MAARACPYPARRRTVKANGIRFRIETEGSGPPLVLVHGGPGGNHCYFHPNLSRLSSRRKLVYYDLRGHCASSAPADENAYGPAYDVEDLEALRKALGFSRFDLLGHSYGGIVAFRYALKYPRNVRRLALCSAPVCWTEKDRRQLRQTPAAKRFETAWAAASPEEKTRLYYGWYYARKPGRKTVFYNELTRAAYKTGKIKQALSAYDKDKTRTDWRKLLSVKIPVLLVFGGKDTEIRHHKAQALVSGASNVSLAVLKNCGHDVFSDEPEKFARLISGFLA